MHEPYFSMISSEKVWGVFRTFSLLKVFLIFMKNHDGNLNEILPWEVLKSVVFPGTSFFLVFWLHWTKKRPDLDLKWTDGNGWLMRSKTT